LLFVIVSLTAPLNDAGVNLTIALRTTPDLQTQRMQAGDAWAAGCLPKVFASPQYQAGRTVFIMTFDEGSAKRTDVPFIVVSPYTPVGYTTNLRMDDYATLKGMEQMLGLGLLGQTADAGTPSIRDFYGLNELSVRTLVLGLVYYECMITTGQIEAEQELASLCGVLNSSYARLVAIVAQALSDESWAIAGVRSPEHWLTMRAGLSPFRAKAIVRVARRHGELPTVMGEFSDGQLSFDQVAVVARYAPAHVEASVAEMAVFASVPQLRRSLSHYSFDPPAEPGYTERNATFDSQVAAARAAEALAAEVLAAGAPAIGDTSTDEGATGQAHPGEGAPADNPPTWNGFALTEDRSGAPAELSMSHDEWGRFTMRFTASADLGALVEAALKEAKDALFKGGRPDVTFGDAMVEIAGRSMGAVESTNRRDAYRTYVFLDTDGGWLAGQRRLPKHIEAKMTCDGILQPVWLTQGAPVNVGRAQRIVPTRTRRLVEDRDRGCRFPGCTSTRVECHHLIHWVDGGPTDTWNLSSLCSFHHDGHHVGDFTISGDADDPRGLTFTTRHGHPIRPGPTFTSPTDPQPPPEAPHPDLRQPDLPQPDLPQPCSAASGATSTPPVAPYRGPSGETLDLGWVTFHGPREPAYSA